jgi:Heterokaryon incompatibility protein (HET)
MHVTVSLGMEYLWVDRYCIDQSNKQNKHRQIQQMDLIYSAAQLTIIAAAGEDLNLGLPGINGTMRANQELLRIQDLLII